MLDLTQNPRDVLRAFKLTCVPEDMASVLANCQNIAHTIKCLKETAFRAVKWFTHIEVELIACLCLSGNNSNVYKNAAGLLECARKRPRGETSYMQRFALLVKQWHVAFQSRALRVVTITLIDHTWNHRFLAWVSLLFWT